MLHDTPTLVAGSEIERQLVEEGKRGQTFPISPSVGDQFELTETDQGKAPGLYVYASATKGWILQENSNDGAKFYDLALTVFDRPKSNALVAKHLSVRAFFLNANFDRSLAMASELATENYSFAVSVLEADRVTERAIGTIDFAAGEVIGTFNSITSDPMIIDRHETLLVRGAEVRDATLRNIDITLAGRLASTI